ncbi:hypothetical protein [Nocardioides sp.]|uniref:hypothetical protein n=1 Tax=Nocardioides sp. TaxID=35761 RepID=UPI00286D0569|nr:hypothetical protein [Nocardioides sp.]
MRTCDFCGRDEAGDEADGEAALTWSTAVERGQPVAYCPACSREHLRSMEGKLDAEHW